MKSLMTVFLMVCVAGCSSDDASEDGLDSTGAATADHDAGNHGNPENSGDGEDSTGVEEGFWGEAFFASDLSAAVQTGISESLEYAAGAWGTVGPIEYWVLGTDRDAALELVDLFCTRRAERGDWEKTECVNFHSNTSGPPFFMGYHALGERVIEDNAPSGSAGMNGQGLEWGIYLFGSSYPYAFDRLFDFIAPEEETKVVFHEYFHAVQHSHIATLDARERNALLGPVWFNEGGAEFMAQATSSMLFNNGTMPRSGVSWNSFEVRMVKWLNQGREILANQCPGKEMKDIEYSDPCSGAAYGLGAWAHAYLAHLAGPDILLGTFYPRVEELGWEAAFGAAYGMSVDAFYTEFNAFLAKSIDEQRAILPDVGGP